MEQNEALLSANLVGIACIYLPLEQGLSEQVTIIMPRLDFIENTVYQVNTKDNKIAVKLGPSMDMKDD